MDWTDDRVESLKKLYADGLSASQIAGELGGVSRNAVIGKAHRLGLTKRGRPVAQPRKPRTYTPRARKVWRANFPKLEDATPAKEVIPPPNCARVAITQLSEATCRWPIGDPAKDSFAYCGAPPIGGQFPYCPYHSQLAYQPPTEKQLQRRRDRQKYYSTHGSARQ